ncbi:Nucleotide-binding universal stress protein, UspA family [Aquiflexum balticum DSM 16537]|uniref:Nucleotide-binding universal stress protein, UspA family n=1 Tax=Aquiflexum balticum DSM 16537 TaxID=758820 RepID=A0A1W2H9C8_9BACT|nr:universal stress protein [Aquiflexum balticum]SMD45475.1 Nucleotide-binding universal stress protein, UspA family [Aquiflexum balticum DSM 16537]
MKKILVPTDFSACALSAENYAFFLAKKTDAEMVFLHIINTPVDWSKLSKEQENLFPDTKKAISDAKVHLNELIHKAQGQGIRSSKLLVYNNGNIKIHEFVASEHIDLVVMGSHGQYGFKDHILGTNTYSMLRRSKIPVVVVKENNTMAKLKTLVVATNLREETGHAFKSIETLAEVFGAKIKMVYVNTPTYFLETNDIKQLGREYLREYANYEHEIEVIDAFKEERGILQYAKNIDAEGIAVVTAGKSDLMQYFSPSITENLIAMTDLPVISIRK